MDEARKKPRKHPASVPFFVYEAAEFHNDRRTKKAAIMCAFAGAAAIAANAALIVFMLKGNK